MRERRLMMRRFPTGCCARRVSRRRRAFALGGLIKQELRYGENPHQKAAFYRLAESRFGVATARQIQGKELSYNNINDTDAAIECVAEFDAARPAVRDRQARQSLRRRDRDRLSEAYRKALRCDPASAFGGIVAVNRKLDEPRPPRSPASSPRWWWRRRRMKRRATSFAAKKNLRLLLTGGLPDPRAAGPALRTVGGGFLVQSRDTAAWSTANSGRSRAGHRRRPKLDD